MKTFLVITGLLLMLSGGLSVCAQGDKPLANTGWVMYFQITGNNMGVHLVFYEKDSLKLEVYGPGHTLLLSQAMRYSISDQVPAGFKGKLLTLTSTADTRPCGDQTVGRYAFTISGNMLDMHPVNDDCAERLEAVSNRKWNTSFHRDLTLR